MGCRAQPVRYPISRTVQQMTRETRMGQPSYTEFRILPGPVVDRGPILDRVGMLEPVPPVRQRHVVVDADEIDLRIGPERIEVEEHVAAAITSLVPEIFQPVRRVSDLSAGFGMCGRPVRR